MGALRPGLVANFVVCSAHLLADDNVLLDNWVQGERYQLSTVPADYRGVYALQIGQQPVSRFLIEGKPEAPELKVVPADGDTIRATLAVTSDLTTIVFNPKDKIGKGKKPSMTPGGSRARRRRDAPQRLLHPGGAHLPGRGAAS